VREARKLGIPVVAVVDTNCDPSEVDYVIPGNDDALRAIRLFASKIADSAVEGSQAATDKQVAEVQGAVEAIEHPEAEEVKPEGESIEAASEDISMEDVLGGRKKPVPAEAPETEDATARHAEV